MTAYRPGASDRLITAPADSMTGAEFYERVFPGYAERKAKRMEQMRVQCLAAYDRGDTYGWPPLLVEQFVREREEMQLTECRPDPLLNRKDAA